MKKTLLSLLLIPILSFNTADFYMYKVRSNKTFTIKYTSINGPTKMTMKNLVNTEVCSSTFPEVYDGKKRAVFTTDFKIFDEKSRFSGTPIAYIQKTTTCNK